MNLLFHLLSHDDVDSLNNFLQEKGGNDIEKVVNMSISLSSFPSRLVCDQSSTIQLLFPSFYHSGTNIPILSLSALFGSVNCFRLLLMSGADISMCDSIDRLPVHFACAGGNIEICDMLDSSGADFTLNDKYGRTCLHYACLSGCIELVERFWARNFDLACADSFLMQPIHYASLYSKNINDCLNEESDDQLELNYDWLYMNGCEVFDFLRQKGCDISASTKDGSTPFTIALKHSPCVLNYLLEQCDVNEYYVPRINKDLKIIPTNEFEYKHETIEDMIQKRIKGEVDKADDSSLQLHDKQSPLIDFNHLYVTDDEEEEMVTPLIDACRKRKYGIVAVLLKRNPDLINLSPTIHSTYSTPSKSESFPLVDVEQADIFGWSPLLTAVERGCIKIVKLLVQKGANVNKTSKNGFSPLLASKNRHFPKISLFLESLGAVLHPM